MVIVVVPGQESRRRELMSHQCAVTSIIFTDCSAVAGNVGKHFSALERLIWASKLVISNGDRSVINKTVRTEKQFGNRTVTFHRFG